MLPNARAVLHALRALPPEERHRRLKLSPRLVEAADRALTAWSGDAAEAGDAAKAGGATGSRRAAGTPAWATGTATRATDSDPAAGSSASTTSPSAKSSPLLSRPNFAPAAFAYTGETYRGLAARELADHELAQLQARVRILSALYGVLRPLDLIEQYRLDFGTRLSVNQASSLYDYWREGVTQTLAADALEASARAVVNLASNEFVHVVSADGLGLPLITPEFRQQSGRTLKNVTVFTKQARGAMARWIVVSGARTPAELTEFDQDGYRFDPASSSVETPRFVRDSD
jgi:hypothetical protein